MLLTSKHELGYLLLYRHRAPAGPKAQQAASAFASAFLMPTAAVHADAPHSPAIDQVIALARKWGEPLATLASRLHRLGLFSAWQYRTLREVIPTLGAADKSVSAEDRETSLLLPRIFASLRSRGVTKHKLASTVHIYPKDLDDLAFGLVRAGFDGAISSGQQIEGLRPRLTIVASNA